MASGEQRKDSGRPVLGAPVIDVASPEPEPPAPPAAEVDADALFESAEAAVRRAQYKRNPFKSKKKTIMGAGLVAAKPEATELPEPEPSAPAPARRGGKEGTMIGLGAPIPEKPAPEPEAKPGAEKVDEQGEGQDDGAPTALAPSERAATPQSKAPLLRSAARKNTVLALPVPTAEPEQVEEQAPQPRRRSRRALNAVLFLLLLVLVGVAVAERRGYLELPRPPIGSD